MKIDIGEKIHQCSQCDNVFIKKTNLTNHMRTHTGGTLSENLRTEMKLKFIPVINVANIFAK